MLEHDNCGIGAVVNIKGEQTHQVVSQALEIVENLEHRAGKDAEGKTGDGVGILLQISHSFFREACRKEGIPIGEEREYGVECFSSLKTSFGGIRPARCLRQSQRKRDLFSLGGEKFRSVRRY